MKEYGGISKQIAQEQDGYGSLVTKLNTTSTYQCVSFAFNLAIIVFSQSAVQSF